MLFYKNQIKAYVESLSSHNLTQTENSNILHGTTIVALKYKSGVVMAADMRVTLGGGGGASETGLDSFEKIFLIDEKVLMEIAGLAAIGLQAVRFLKFEIKHWEKTEEEKLSFEGKANILSQILGQFSPLALKGMATVAILANKEQIYWLDELGGKYSVNNWIIGSGRPYGVAEVDKWKKDLTRKDAVKLAVKALKNAEINQQTGPNRLIYTIGEKIQKVSKTELNRMLGGKS